METTNARFKFKTMINRFHEKRETNNVVNPQLLYNSFLKIVCKIYKKRSNT